LVGETWLNHVKPPPLLVTPAAVARSHSNGGFTAWRWKLLVALPGGELSELEGFDGKTMGKTMVS